MKYIVTVRGMLKAADEKQSQATHDATIDKIGPLGKSMGNIGHQVYLNPQNRREFMAIDTWNNLDGPQKLLSDPALGAEFAKLFDGQPSVTLWAEADWKSW
jgi:hypothetical protein